MAGPMLERQKGGASGTCQSLSRFSIQQNPGQSYPPGEDNRQPRWTGKGGAVLSERSERASGRTEGEPRASGAKSLAKRGPRPKAEPGGGPARSERSERRGTPNSSP